MKKRATTAIADVFGLVRANAVSNLDRLLTPAQRARYAARRVRARATRGTDEDTTRRYADLAFGPGVLTGVADHAVDTADQFFRSVPADFEWDVSDYPSEVDLENAQAWLGFDLTQADVNAYSRVYRARLRDHLARSTR